MVNGRNLRTGSFNARHQGGARAQYRESLSPLSQSSFSRTMRRDRQGTEGRQASRNKEGCRALFHDLRKMGPPVENAERVLCIAEGAESTLLSAGEGGANLAFDVVQRRAYDHESDWLFMTHSENYNPPLRLQCQR